jgi:hypothetical protein
LSFPAVGTDGIQGYRDARNKRHIAQAPTDAHDPEPHY